jgi:Arc/MetJ-type ribon-helix-helix transcriptional regulator
MDTLKISLPPALKSFVEEQLAAGNHKNHSAYIADLVNAERKRLAEQKLIRLMKEADDSGPARPVTAQTWKRIRARALARLAKEKRQHGKNRHKTRS